MLEIFLGALGALDVPDDGALLRKIAGGDAAALRALYDRCAGQAMAVCLRILREEREAEEAVQETFVDAWKRAGSYDAARGSAIGWIVSMARSRALDRLRSRGAGERLKANVAALPAEKSAPAPLELAEQQQDRERIRRALDQLTPPQRSAIELAYFDGLTQREIAEKVGEPLGTVKSRMRAALQRLAALLAGESAP
jgi:RNA polymerase sigma-70 factor (ECF subfamily)